VGDSTSYYSEFVYREGADGWREPPMRWCTNVDAKIDVSCIINFMSFEKN